MIFMDDPRHAKFRLLLARQFTPARGDTGRTAASRTSILPKLSPSELTLILSYH